MARSVLIYDGECNFCVRWVGRLKHMTKDRVEYLPSQEVCERFPLRAMNIRFNGSVHREMCLTGPRQFLELSHVFRGRHGHYGFIGMFRVLLWLQSGVIKQSLKTERPLEPSANEYLERKWTLALISIDGRFCHQI